MVQIGDMERTLEQTDARPTGATLISDSRGAAAIEAALTLPIVLAALLGILAYGNWFMAAHGVQQAAQEGARAAVGGLDDTERTALAKAGTNKAIAVATAVDPDFVQTRVERSGTYMTVIVSYDPANPPWRLGPLVPTPKGPISRKATIRINDL